MRVVGGSGSSGGVVRVEVIGVVMAVALGMVVMVSVVMTVVSWLQ